MRIDPPPSLPWARGTTPVATAMAAPPLEPPAERCGAQGLRAGPPLTSASVVGAMHSAGTVVRAKGNRPAASKRSTSMALPAKRMSLHSASPMLEGRRSQARPESFNRNGRPPNTPVGRQAAARASAAS
ncbi:Uncharacterised protein [Bordetella pertussis]|nr:Uncharacterised protein [Bordetella pertussis]CPM66236.1 Uncharacterised protein [Bordetella pertussis]